MVSRAAAQAPVTAPNDSLRTTPKSAMRQWRVGVDIFKPLLFLNTPGKKSLEITNDIYWKQEFYWVIDGGWGQSKYDYPDLSYTTTNTFIRVGFDKSLLPRLLPGDWDMITMGLRYGAAFINRSEGHYIVHNTVWGDVSGSVPGGRQQAHWGELAAGMRMDLWKHFGAGWNMRGKFLLNAKSLKALPPDYIAGYGKGEKGTVFDFNIYLTYVLIRKP